MKDNNFDWVKFYQEFAHKLLQYQNDRKTLIGKVREIFSNTKIKLPTLEKDNKIVDIDPFTVFGLFNKSSMTKAKRISIISEIKKLFNINAPIPTSFDGIPVLMNMNSTYYFFIGERQDKDIEYLWNLFRLALDYSVNQNKVNENNFIKYFNLVMNQKGVGKSKLTMGLFWMCPQYYLNLDRKNTWYIYETDKLPLNIVDNLPTLKGELDGLNYVLTVKILRDYITSNDSQYKNFIDLSAQAWDYAGEVNLQNKENENLAKENKIFTSDDENLTKEKEINRNEQSESVHYWIYSPGSNACKWDEYYKNGIMAINWSKIGNLKWYNSKQAMKNKMKEIYDANLTYMNAAHLTWQFANEIKIGDVIFVKHGRHKLIGRGVVTSDYIYDKNRIDCNVRKVKWTHNGEWKHTANAVVKTLTDVTSYTEYCQELQSLFNDVNENDIDEKEIKYATYSKNDFLNEVFMQEEKYNDIINILKYKKNIVLQGAPGTGKTFLAKRLAYSIMGVKDTQRVKMIQFHQSYSYEDLIMGYRPTTDGFELKYGAFYDFCKKAEIDSDNDYFFIIDEINRGNLSKIFGELFMLIESDKRGMSLQLLYADEQFSVPKNVFIIGMMNTADRSLAIIDYALRRRFAFFEIETGFDSVGFKQYQQKLNNSKFNKLIECVKNLNNAIVEDDSLGNGFCIGHSYFCSLTNIDYNSLNAIVEYELIPLLKEYWFDEHNKVEQWTFNLRSAIK